MTTWKKAGSSLKKYTLYLPKIMSSLFKPKSIDFIKVGGVALKI